MLELVGRWRGFVATERCGRASIYVVNNRDLYGGGSETESAADWSVRSIPCKWKQKAILCTHADRLDSLLLWPRSVVPPAFSSSTC